ncbi:MAG: glutamate--cysteine ligase, partial [Pirellulaceae bacterium]|nr:glutamate--cysteine ligase [Pirellulaceae bacterium]
MGEDISKTTFDERDYARFRQRMDVEMAQLRSWEQAGSFAAGPLTTGLELEAWLLESDGRPSPDNGQFLESLAHASVVPELAKFNFELNVDPQPVAGLGIERMQAELLHTWQLCGERAAQLNRRITCIGILPTVTQAMLCAKNMTPRSRFEALNRQVLRLRHGKPLRVQVEGIDQLDLLHHDVMLESAATSLQVHLKVPLDQAARYYNAFAIASSATVALAANAPLVFGKRLWHDSRIAMFEQAVDTGQGLRRVSFGEGYASRDFLALFEDKILGFPPLLPVDLQDHPQRVPHLRLHNGTLWLWNRPLIGFEEDGQPHIRIEHRVMSAGPTAVDMLANVSFSLGLAEAL